MTKRFRNISAAFGVSITMWVGIIYGAVALYQGTTLTVDHDITASIR